MELEIIIEKGRLRNMCWYFITEDVTESVWSVPRGCRGLEQLAEKLRGQPSNRGTFINHVISCPTDHWSKSMARVSGIIRFDSPPTRICTGSMKVMCLWRRGMTELSGELHQSDQWFSSGRALVEAPGGSPGRPASLVGPVRAQNGEGAEHGFCRRREEQRRCGSNAQHVAVFCCSVPPPWSFCCRVGV